MFQIIAFTTLCGLFFLGIAKLFSADGVRTVGLWTLGVAGVLLALRAFGALVAYAWRRLTRPSGSSAGWTADKRTLDDDDDVVDRITVDPGRQQMSWSRGRRDPRQDDYDRFLNVLPDHPASIDIVRIAGTRYENRGPLVAALTVNEHVFCWPDRRNLHDLNAVGVLNRGGQMLGYIPAADVRGIWAHKHTRLAGCVRRVAWLDGAHQAVVELFPADLETMVLSRHLAIAAGLTSAAEELTAIGLSRSAAMLTRIDGLAHKEVDNTTGIASRLGDRLGSVEKGGLLRVDTTYPDHPLRTREGDRVGYLGTPPRWDTEDSELVVAAELVTVKRTKTGLISGAQVRVYGGFRWTDEGRQLAETLGI